MFLFRHQSSMPRPEEALKGRSEPIVAPTRHFVNGASLTGPWPDGTQTAVFGLGCFWFLLYSIGCDGRLRSIFCSTPLRYLGNMSYSYYLLHGLTLQAMFLALAAFFPPDGQGFLFSLLLLRPARRPGLRPAARAHSGSQARVPADRARLPADQLDCAMRQRRLAV